MYHPSIVAMRNFYIDKGTKSGKGRLNLVLDYVKFGDLSIVIFHHLPHVDLVLEVPPDLRPH